MGFGLSGGGKGAFRSRGDHKGGAELTLSGGVTLCKGNNTAKKIRFAPNDR